MQNIIDMYLDWTNNYLTLETFAEHNCISVDLASLIIKEGRILHELHCGGYESLDTPKQNYFDQYMSY